MTLSREKILHFYEQILLIRESEKKICAEYPSDEIKTPVHLCVGAEAIAAGVLECLDAEARIFGTYRNHGIYLGRTGDTDGFFAELYGKASGCAGGKAGSMHLTYPEKGFLLTSAVVATTLPVAAGAAFARAYQKSPALTVVFFGDGAFEEGAFWESINFACLHRLRLLFICEDNGLAIHAPSSTRQGFRSIPEVVSAFNCYTARAEGHRVDDIFAATEELIRKMNKDPKPGFLYTPYFRFLEHVGINEDFHFEYRTRPSAAELKEKDPLEYVLGLASKAGIPAGDLRKIENRVREKIDQSVEKAKSAPFPEPSALFCESPED